MSGSKLGGPVFWFVGFLFYFFSISLSFLHGSLNEHVLQVLANAFEFLGSFAQLAGFLEYYRCESRRRLNASAFTVMALFFIASAVCEFGGVHGLFSIFETAINLVPVCIILVLSVSKLRKQFSHFYFSVIVYSTIALIFSAQLLFQLYAAVSHRNGIGILSGQSWDYGPLVWSFLIAVLVFSQSQMANGFLRGVLAENLSQLNAYQKSLIHLNERLTRANKDIIVMFADALDIRISETSDHVVRVSEYTRILLDRLGCRGGEAEIIAQAAALHDVGKIGISDQLLRCERKFTDSEKKEMESHTLIGFDILGQSESPLLKRAAIIALEHHEHWDGSGYPLGKSGEGISFASRVVAVADVFDALIHHRSYKDEWPVSDAVRYIVENGGFKFDPYIVAVLPDCIEAFIEIAGRNMEGAGLPSPDPVAAVWK
jgi:hypothetical protein